MTSLALVTLASVAGCSGAPSAARTGAVGPAPVAASAPDRDAPAPLPAVGPGEGVSVFAGGCFWCLESDFDKMPGIVSTTSGYAGGHVPDPTYEQVGSHVTGHLESVRVTWDAGKTDYAHVLDWFWHHIDPTDPGGQFCDRGEPYQTGIFPADEAQSAAATASKTALDAAHTLPGPVATRIFEVGTAFYAAENYHQDFHETTPGRYDSYRLGCGRDAKVALIWGLQP